VVEEAVNQS